MDVELVLIERDGTRKVRCCNCRAMFRLNSREIAAMEKLKDYYACICERCVDAAVSYDRQMERRERRSMEA